jgi:uncharacterized membrane protein YidH (DUF202 family)
MKLPSFILLLVGSLLTVWGAWVFYTAIANYEPQSELPRSFSWAASAVLLALGIGVLALGRAVHRRTRHPASSRPLVRGAHEE